MEAHKFFGWFHTAVKRLNIYSFSNEDKLSSIFFIIHFVKKQRKTKWYLIVYKIDCSFEILTPQQTIEIKLLTKRLYLNNQF